MSLLCINIVELYVGMFTCQLSVSSSSTSTLVEVDTVYIVHGRYTRFKRNLLIGLSPPVRVLASDVKKIVSVLRCVPIRGVKVVGTRSVTTLPRFFVPM